MKRIIDYFLLQWKHDELRMPLLLRGARQIGKTYAVRQLGKSYESFVEINLEKNIEAHKAFQENLDPAKMILLLEAATQTNIIPGKTLLFLDEIQSIPRAITALRYFYEELPELHVIAAGSLIDFAIQKYGIPVGRVECLYMYPLSFIEYLVAVEDAWSLKEILQHDIHNPMPSASHERLLKAVGSYLAFGGMPQVIHNWITTKKIMSSAKIHTALLNVYRQDFEKYAREYQIKYVEKIFQAIPQQLGRKFKYSAIDGDFRKRELSPALDLLVTAGIAHKVHYSAAQGIPIDAQADPLDYKVIFLDSGLAQANLGLDLASWFLATEEEFINKGALVEAFVGQEILAYLRPDTKRDLCYWHKDSGAQQAEIDYLIQIHQKIIPVEVKSGDGRTLRSIRYFLELHKNSPYGIRFSANNYSEHENIHSYPLYAIAKVMIDGNATMKAAIQALLA
jgi:uncharacterized protein